MSARTIATALAAIRVALGAAFFVAPRTSGRLWLGAAADARGGTMALRGLGARDLVVGVGSLLTVDDPESGPRWVEAGVVADTADLTAAVLAVREQDAARVLVTVASAGVAAATGLWLRTALRRPAA